MRWIARIAAGFFMVLVIGFAGLSYATREPNRPVVRMPISSPLLLTGVTIVDPRTGTIASDRAVLMDKGRIVSVTSTAAAPSDPSIRRIDVTGRFVVPGYNDMHAHALGAADPSGSLALMLANGVTGFRQMSGSEAMLGERRESRLPLGKDSPAVLAMPGPILTPLNADTAEQARETVRAQKAAGADFVKVGVVAPTVLVAVLDEAKQIGISVDGHVPPGVALLDAAQSGMRAIEHLGPANGMLIACSSQAPGLLAQVREANPTPRGPPVMLPFIDKIFEWALQKRVINPAAASHEAAGVTFMAKALASKDDNRCRRTAQRLRAAGNWQVPTLIRLKTTLLGDDQSFANDPNLRFVSPGTVASWREVNRKFAALYTPAEHQTLERAYQRSLELVKLLDEEGVRMLAGSDVVGGGWEIAGFSLHQEFDELAKAGLSPLRILQMTTSDAADFLGRTQLMGAVAQGMNANLVILSADPRIDVSNLHSVVGVVRAGFLYDEAALTRLKERVAEGRGVLRQ